MADDLAGKYYLAALSAADGLGQAALSRVIDYFSSPLEAWNAPKSDFVAAGLTPQQADNAVELAKNRPNYPEEIADLCNAKNIGLVSLNDDDYPRLLKEIFNPPLVLYYRGCLSQNDKCLAMVGSRRQSPYGKKVAETLAGDLANMGATIVSGAAYGIDASSHIGVLKAAEPLGRTIAVLGCGVDVAYPASHRQLIDQIAEKGAVISEYAPGTTPLPGYFPMRNRIISGLSFGTIVVEAAQRSGSLITAELALSEGRDVFAVPGSIFSETSSGTNRLIQQGAKLVRSAADIAEEYPWLSVKKKKKATTLPSLSQEEQRIYDILSTETPLSVDDVIYRLHGRTDAANVAFLLLQMEMKGMVEANSARAYTRSAK